MSLYLNQQVADDLLLTQFSEMCKKMGFNDINRDVFFARKKYVWGWKHISLSIMARGEFSPVYIFHYMRVNCIEEIWEPYIKLIGLTNESGHYSTMLVPLQIAWPDIGLRRNQYNELCVESTNDGIKDLIATAKIAFEEKMLPLGEQWRDIKVMDKLINDSDVQKARQIFGSGGDFHLRKLIITKLSGNPDFELIFEKMISSASVRVPTSRNAPAIVTK